MTNSIEKTLVMIKPHPEKYTNKNQKIFREIINDYASSVGYTIENERNILFTENEAILHYKHLTLVHFFQEIIDYITSGDSHLMLISGENAISKMNNFKKISEKNISAIHDFLTRYIIKKPIYNILHTSDSKSEAKREVERYF